MSENGNEHISFLAFEIRHHQGERKGHTELFAYLSIGLMVLSFLVFASDDPLFPMVYVLIIGGAFDLILLGFIFWHEYCVRRLLKEYPDPSRHIAS